MRENYRFHFTQYRSGGSDVLVRLLECVWMKFGHFLHSFFSINEKSAIVGKHQMAL